MKLIAGLGNPGAKYARNRHNIGFLAVDEIARRAAVASWRSRFQGETANCVLGGGKALLLKPATFMNESGRSVGEAMRYFSLQPEDVIVIHDELDLPPGKMRIKSGGGHAGHNGIRSIIAHIGDKFHRLRIGIGHPGDKALVHSYVLKDPGKSELEMMLPVIEAIARHAHLLASGDLASFQNRVHLDTAPPATAGSDKKENKNGL